MERAHDSNPAGCCTMRMTHTKYNDNSVLTISMQRVPLLRPRLADPLFTAAPRRPRSKLQTLTCSTPLPHDVVALGATRKPHEAFRPEGAGQEVVGGQEVPQALGMERQSGSNTESHVSRFRGLEPQQRLMLKRLYFITKTNLQLRLFSLTRSTFQESNAPPKIANE